MTQKAIPLLLFFFVFKSLPAQYFTMSVPLNTVSEIKSHEILPPAIQAYNNTYLWQLDSIGHCDETMGRSHYYYDNSHRLIKEYYNNRMQKNEFFYDASDRLTMMLLSYYDDFLSNNWSPVQLWQYAYNENDIPISYEVSFWTYDMTYTTLQWVKQFREDVLLDSNGLAVERNAYYWMNDLSQWYNHTKTVFHYSSQLREDLVYEWDSLISDWKPIAKRAYYTDVTGKDSLSVSYNYDGTGWLASSKYELGFDANGNITQIMISDYINNLWHESRMTSYYYETAYTADDIIIPFIFFPKGNNMLTHYTSHIKDSTAWVLFYCDTLYYNDFSQGLPQVANTAPHVFPNPFSEFFYVEISGNYKLELYDLQGRLVMNVETEGRSRVGAAHLSRGLYFFRLHQNTQTFSGKIIKQ